MKRHASLLVNLWRGSVHLSRRGLMLGAVLVILTFTNTAFALMITDFLIFGGGDVNIAGASLYTGNIGSNTDLTIGASETQVLGSVYVVDTFSMQAPGEIGTDGSPSFSLEQNLGSVPGVYDPLDVTVVANTGDFENANALIYGTLDLVGGTPSPEPGGTYTSDYTATADTFGGITMTSGVSFTAGGADQEILNGTPNKTLALDDSVKYGALTAVQDATLELASGDYYFDRFGTSNSSLGGNLTLKIDLSSGAPININIVEYAKFGGDTKLLVKGAGTDDEYVRISEAPQLAGLINWNLGGVFDMTGGDYVANAPDWTSFFGGTLYSYLFDGPGSGSIGIGQNIDWYGALYAYDTITLADHSRYTYVPVAMSVVPEPSTALLLGAGLLGIGVLSRKKKSRKKAS